MATDPTIQKLEKEIEFLKKHINTLNARLNKVELENKRIKGDVQQSKLDMTRLYKS